MAETLSFKPGCLSAAGPQTTIRSESRNWSLHRANVLHLPTMEFEFDKFTVKGIYDLPTASSRPEPSNLSVIEATGTPSINSQGAAFFCRRRPSLSRTSCEHLVRKLCVSGHTFPHRSVAKRHQCSERFWKNTRVLKKNDAVAQG
jgi:hypothetical protein